MILEGIVTTLDIDGKLNVAPMGPMTEDENWSRFTLRPFKTSTTYRNLKERGEGVFHITDDVLLLARAAIGPVPDAKTVRAGVVAGRVLVSCARYHEFRVVDLDDHDDRTTIQVETVCSGRFGDLFGLNRAKFAVVEAAILATRIGLLPPGEVREGLDRLEPLVTKTGGAAEREAFALLRAYAVLEGRTP